VSLEALNQIIGEAIINKEFCRVLLLNPPAAVVNFDLAVEEVDLLTTIRAQSLDHLARRLISELNLENPGDEELVFGSNGHGLANGQWAPGKVLSAHVTQLSGRNGANGAGRSIYSPQNGHNSRLSKHFAEAEIARGQADIVQEWARHAMWHDMAQEMADDIRDLT